MSRTFKIHGSGPFAGICIYASIKHLSLFGEGVVMGFDPIPAPDNFHSSSEIFSSLEIDMNTFTPMIRGSISTDLFFVEPNDIPALWTAWAKWYGSIGEDHF